MTANRNMRRGWLVALCGVALGAAACARTPQMLTPARPEARAHISRIGILGPPPLRFTYGEPPPPGGAGAGYERTVKECFEGAAATVHPIPLLAASVLCPTVFGALGAALTSSEAEVAEARAALERVGAENVGDALRGDLVVLLARDAPQYAVALLGPDGTDPLGAPVDTVVALKNLSVTLMPCSRRSTSGAPLTLYAAVDAELRRADTRAVVHRARIEYWGETFPFGAWGGAGAERLALGLARAQRSLAEQLVQSFFLAQGRMAMKWPFCENQLWRKRW